MWLERYLVTNQWACAQWAGKNSVYTQMIIEFFHDADIKIIAGCSKSSSSKAAGEPKPEAYPLGYVEDFDEPRTTLAGFFSILLKVSRLDDIFDAINVEPVPGCVQHPDRILPFQQFLKKLGDAGFAVSWLG